MNIQELSSLITQKGSQLPLGMDVYKLKRNLDEYKITIDQYDFVLDALDRICLHQLEKEIFVTSSLQISVNISRLNELIDSFSRDAIRIPLIDKLLLQTYISAVLGHKILEIKPSSLFNALIYKNKNEKKLGKLEPLIQIHEMLMQKNVNAEILLSKFRTAIEAGFNINNSILIILEHYSKQDYIKRYL